MAIKIIYLFNAGRKGWTETWYANPGAVDLDSFITTAKAVASFRRKLLATPYSLEAIRLSNTDVKGHSFLTRMDNGGGLAPAQGQRKDVTKQALLCRVEDESGLYKRPWLVRGCPDAWFAYAGAREIENPQAKAAIEVFRAAVRDAGFCIRAIARNKGVGANPIRTIQAINLNGSVNPGHIAFKVPTHGYVAGDFVRVSKCRFVGTPAPEVNGVWEVLTGAVAPALDIDWISIDLAFDQRFIDFVRYFHGGVVQKRSIVYPPIAENGIHLERFTQRDTGSAFFRGRGRSRGVKR